MEHVWVLVILLNCQTNACLSISVHFTSVAQSCLTLCWPHGLQHPRLPCLSPTPRDCLNSLYVYFLLNKGEGNGKPLQYSWLENSMNGMKSQKYMALKDELFRSVGAQYATGEEWRNSSGENEQVKPKQKQCPVVDVTGDGSKVWCCKEQYCVGTWSVMSINQVKLEVVKQEVARVNINILRSRELKRTGMGEFNSDDHYIYYCGQESLRRDGIALSQQRSPKCSTWVQSQK